MWQRPLTPGISIGQTGFGAAMGGTLGCFVEDVATNEVMLLSNMHVLQFFKKPSILFSSKASPNQLGIVQPCTIEIKDLARNFVGHDKRRVWDAAHPAPLSQQEARPRSYGTFPQARFPTATDAEIDKFYTGKLEAQLSYLLREYKVAEFARGALEENFDAGVATLKDGVSWTNTVPDGTVIEAPPQKLSLEGRFWKYGDASGSKKWARCRLNDKDTHVHFKTWDNDSSGLGLPDAAMRLTPKTFQAGQVWKVTGEGEGQFQIQGDSGAVLCDEHNRLVAIMSATDAGNTAYAIPIDVVFKRLNLRFPSTISGVA